MIFKILGTEMGPIVLSDEERRRALPDINSLLEMYFNKHLAENLMEHVKNEPIRCEKVVNKVVEEVGKGTIGEYSSKPICFDIQSITANHKKNAFTVVWGDGSHTIVHLQPGDVWDDEKALAMCFVKHMMGDTGSFNDIFTEDMPAKIKHIGKVEPVEEKHECHCDTPCKECHCGIEKAEETPMDAALAKIGEAAGKAGTAMKKMVAELTDSKPLTSRIEGPYKVFIKNAITPAGARNALIPAGTYNTVKLAKERAIGLATQIMGSKPHYYRLWTDEGKLYVDFGSYSKYIVLEGVGTEDWYNV